MKRRLDYTKLPFNFTISTNNKILHSFAKFVVHLLKFLVLFSKIRNVTFHSKSQVQFKNAMKNLSKNHPHLIDLLKTQAYILLMLQLNNNIQTACMFEENVKMFVFIGQFSRFLYHNVQEINKT